MVNRQARSWLGAARHQIHVGFKSRSGFASAWAVTALPRHRAQSARSEPD